MTKPAKVDITFPINNVKVVNDLYCTQLTHRIVPNDNLKRNCKYEVYDNCIGTKVVNIQVGPRMFKFHDGCLGRVSHELGQMATSSDRIVIENAFAQSTTLALNYILKPFHVTTITSQQKYDLVLFGARYGLPPRHISRLIDRSIYADLVEYAWKNNNTYLMAMLQKLRIPDLEIVEDFSNTNDQTWFKFVRKNSSVPKARVTDVETASGNIKVDNQPRLKNILKNTKLITLQERIPDTEMDINFTKIDERARDKFVRKYMEHEYRLKKYGRLRVFMAFVAVAMWFFLFYGVIWIDGPWPPRDNGCNRTLGVSPSHRTFYVYRG
uniref:BTB domain-containing protein n=1 Tax=Panagrellus redivivus TaxID=6233 RepID=A0A7E4VTP3_PANRE